MTTQAAPVQFAGAEKTNLNQVEIGDYVAYFHYIGRTAQPVIRAKVAKVGRWRITLENGQVFKVVGGEQVAEYSTRNTIRALGTKRWSNNDAMTCNDAVEIEAAEKTAEGQRQNLLQQVVEASAERRLNSFSAEKLERILAALNS